MKIYTKGGDAGETGLLSGLRVPKDDLRIQAYGTLDEANAAVGLVLAQLNVPSAIATAYLRIQGELFQLGAELATPAGKKTGIRLIQNLEIERLEQEIDAMERELTPLKSFILPGGHPAAAFTHLVRTILRRAEREVVGLNRSQTLRPEVLGYVNRLSDYFFMAARFINQHHNVNDVPWVAPSID